MADKLDLEGGIAEAIDGAALRGKTAVLGYVGDDGYAAISFRGFAHVDPSADDAVYGGMIEGERNQDPDRAGVAVVIDVESVQGFGADGGFEQKAEG